VSPKTYSILTLFFLAFLLIIPVTADLNSVGELKSDKGTPYSFWFLRSSGHTVYFNNSNPITITGIRIYGCKWGSENENANISVSVWDDKLQTLYQDQVPYSKVSLNPLGADNKCSNNAKWADIPLSGYAVNGNFFITVVTESYPINENMHGIYVGYNLNSDTGSSHSTLVSPNRISDTPIRPTGSKTALELSEIDWMIRVLYKNSGNISFSGSATPPVSPSAQPAPATPLATPDTQFPITAGIIGGVAVLAGIGGLVYFRSARNISNVTAETNPSLPATTQSTPLNTTHHDVFISYAHVDKPIADGACAKLESRNIRCWMAPRDVPPGMDFPAAIIKGIEGSRVMVLIFSSHSNVSPHVLREITSAVNKGIIIVPFRIEDITPSKSMEYLISVPHWLDAITPPMEQHFDQLAMTIEKILSDASSREGSP
jgi:hypothetical protein